MDEVTVDKAMWEPAGGWQRELEKANKRIAELEAEVKKYTRYYFKAQAEAVELADENDELKAENQRLREDFNNGELL